MALCDLCGEKAGFLKTRHAECENRAATAKATLYDLVLNGSLLGETYDELKADAMQLCSSTKVPFSHFRETLIKGANDAASQTALQAPITENELNRFVSILQGFGYGTRPEEVVQYRWYGMTSLSMSHTLWQVLNDVTPYYDGAGRMQFNLQAEELPVFSAGKVTFAEERSIHTRSFQSLSIPVGAGLYYRLGGSQEGQQQASGLVPLDTGEALVSDRAFYFGGQQRTLRIPLAHVVRYQPYVDGVGICESHGAPKVFVPDFSGMDTGWFFFNLLSILTKKLSA